MPLVEIEDSELTTLKQAKALLDRFGGDPKTRSQLMALVKQVNPNAVIPEIDAKNEVLAEIKKRDEQLAALRKEVEDDKAARAEVERKAKVDGSISDGRKFLRDAGYTEDGIKGIEDLMDKRGVADYEAAAALFEKSNPAPEAVAPADFSRSWDFAKPGEDEDHKLLLKDPKQFQNKMVRQWMAENRGPQARRR